MYKIIHKGIIYYNMYTYTQKYLQQYKEEILTVISLHFCNWSHDHSWYL